VHSCDGTVLYILCTVHTHTHAYVHTYAVYIHYIITVALLWRLTGVPASGSSGLTSGKPLMKSVGQLVHNQRPFKNRAFCRVHHLTCLLAQSDFHCSPEEQRRLALQDRAIEDPVSTWKGNARRELRRTLGRFHPCAVLEVEREFLLILPFRVCASSLWEPIATPPMKPNCRVQCWRQQTLTTA
jgi:hypothetical protein